MAAIASLHGKTVVTDAAPLIYYIEQNSDEAIEHRKVLEAFFSSVDQGDITLVVSVVTLIEVLILPLRENMQDLVQEYHDILSGSIDSQGALSWLPSQSLSQLKRRPFEPTRIFVCQTRLSLRPQRLTMRCF